MSLRIICDLCKKPILPSNEDGDFVGGGGSMYYGNRYTTNRMLKSGSILNRHQEVEVARIDAHTKCVDHLFNQALKTDPHKPGKCEVCNHTYEQHDTHESGKMTCECLIQNCHCKHYAWDPDPQINQSVAPRSLQDTNIKPEAYP